MLAVDVLLVTIVALASMVVGHGDGCNCELRHPQEQFCQADFAVLAGIRAVDVVYNGDMPMEKHYTVNIKRVYQANDEYGNATKTTIYTSGTSTSCGVEELRIGVNYLITGVIMDGQLQTSICDWVKPFRSLTKTQKNGLRSKYAVGCQCEFATCREDIDCGQVSNNATCEWDIGDMYDCYHNDGICYHNGNECVWRETRKFRACEDKALLGDLSMEFGGLNV